MSIFYAIPNSKRYPIEDDYDIKEELGDGQYSVVKLGVNKNTKEEVAIKFVHRSQTEAKDLVNEVEIMGLVSDHPGFIKLKDVYEDETYYILILDLVRGGELFNKIAMLTTYTEEHVANLLYQLSAALAHLHSKNIVHRDIKPENVLFEDEGATVIKFCDFGVAQKLPETGYLTEIIGTESYMAPEVEAGLPYGVASDMYGLGVIMYIMLCGYPPFEPENGITELEFPEEEWAGISNPAKELITALLDHDAEKRPSAAQVVRSPWIRGDKVNKGHLNGTIRTMKIYNQFRASGNLGSMREAKENKKEAVWSIFGTPEGDPQNKISSRNHKKGKSKKIHSEMKSPKSPKSPKNIPKNSPKTNLISEKKPSKLVLKETPPTTKENQKESQTETTTRETTTTTKKQPETPKKTKKQPSEGIPHIVKRSSSENVRPPPETTETTEKRKNIPESGRMLTPRALSFSSTQKKQRPRNPDHRMPRKSDSESNLKKRRKRRIKSIDFTGASAPPQSTSSSSVPHTPQNPSLLESKLRKRNQKILEITSAYNKLKAENEELRRELHATVQQLEIYKQKERKKREKK